MGQDAQTSQALQSRIAVLALRGWPDRLVAQLLIVRERRLALGMSTIAGLMVAMGAWVRPLEDAPCPLPEGCARHLANQDTMTHLHHRNRYHRSRHLLAVDHPPRYRLER